MPDLLASYLAAVATFCAVTALLPVLREPLAWLRTAIEIVSVGAPPSLATAAFLGILAAAVRRRMRAAWWFVVLYLVLGRILGWITVLIDTDAPDPVVVSAGSGVLAWLRVGFGVAALVLLVVARKRFTARTQRGSGWRALGLYLGVVVLGGLLGWGLLELFPGTLRTTEDRVGWAFTFVLGGLGDPDVTGVDGAAPYAVTFVLGLVGVFAVLAAAYVLFRPRRDQRRLHPDDEQRLRALLHRYGDRDSLGYFATRRDKAAVFSPDRQVGGHLPGGQRREPGQRRPDRRPGGVGPAIDAWLRPGPRVRVDARRDGRERAGAIAPTHRRAPRSSTRRRGDPRRRGSSRWTGRDMRPVRQAVNRVERAGYTAARPPARRHPAEEMRESSRAGRRLARHRDRARLLDGAGPARRPGRRALRAGRGARRPGHGRGDAVVQPVGRARALARPDAPRPRRRQRRSWSSWSPS